MGTESKATNEVDELSQIMNEIDQLHTEMQDESVSNVIPFTGTSEEPPLEVPTNEVPTNEAPTAERTPLSFLDESTEPEAPQEPVLESQMLEETLAVPATRPVSRASAPASTPTSATSEEGTLTMSLTGKMKLNLRYDFENWQVQIGFNDDALHVKLSDGTEFKIPVRSKTR